MGKGYNLIQSTIAVGSGELFGRGLGRGTQSRLQFLPEFRTDFIFASIAEEMGFVGSLLILSLYLFLLFYFLRVAQRVNNSFILFFFIFVFFDRCKSVKYFILLFGGDGCSINVFISGFREYWNECGTSADNRHYFTVNFVWGKFDSGNFLVTRDGCILCKKKVKSNPC